MKIFVSAVMLAICATLTSSLEWISESIPILSDDFIDSINKLNTTWEASRNFNETHTLKDLKKLMGVLHSDQKLEKYVHEYADDLYLRFDARVQWPICDTIGRIGNQAECGSCWAFAAAAVMSDRICIQSRGLHKPQISALDILSCCNDCGNCDGGYPEKAWNYYVSHGVVTGGDYGNKSTCRPYDLGEEAFDETHKPKCIKKCEKDSHEDYDLNKFKGRKAYRLDADEKQIRQDILIYGPVQAVFDVYADFIHYHKGVYQHKSNKKIGRHSVRILGWGEENGVEYWLCANSWGTEWGNLGGFFKIRRGYNECDIEGNVNACVPARSRFEPIE